jgi:hypothetical protein
MMPCFDPSVKGVITHGNNELVYFYLPSYCFKVFLDGYILEGRKEDYSL